jgi:hypothetical protein
MATKKPFGGKKAAPFVANPGGKRSVKRDPSSTKTAKGTKKK